MNISEKYKPSDISEICGYGKSIKDFLKLFEKNKKNGIYYIYGGSGYGKSLIVDLICKKYKMEQVHMKTKKLSENLCDMKVRSIFEKKAFIFDNLDKEGKVITSLIKKSVLKMKGVCVFFIAEDPKILGRSMDINFYNVRKNTSKQITKYLINIVKKEGITFGENGEMVIQKIVDDSRGDFRSCINILDGYLIKLAKRKTKKILYSNKNVNFLDTTKRDEDLDLFQCYGIVTGKSENLDKKLNAYWKNTFVGDLVHTNYLSMMKKNEIELCADIMDNITDGDIIDEFMYKRESVGFTLGKYAGINKCIIPSQILKDRKQGMLKFPPKKVKKDNLRLTDE